MAGFWRGVLWEIRDPTGEERELHLLRGQVAAVRALCADRQAETNDGSMTDIQELWPSQVLAALDAPPDVTR